MPTEREQLLSRLRQFPERLSKIVSPLSDEALRRAGTNGEWGAVEILAHLRDTEEIYLVRIRRILTEDVPELETYDTDMWAIERDYHAQDPVQVLKKFRELRTRLVEWLGKLSDEQWQRRAHHPEAGDITLEQLIERIDRHDHHYLQALKDVLL